MNRSSRSGPQNEVVQQDLVDLVQDARGLPIAKRFQQVMPQPQPIS